MKRTNYFINDKFIMSKEKIIFGVGFLVCLLIHVIPMQYMVGWVCGDINMYYSHAATFLNKDWSGVLENVNNFYSWGYSVVLLIPMIFTTDFIIINYVALIVNILFYGGIYFICYFFLKEFNKDIPTGLKVLITICVSSYTSYLLQGTVLLAESFLYFFVFLDIFCVYKYIKTDKIKWGIISGFSVGFTYIIHNRLISIVVAYFILSIVLSVCKKNVKTFFIMICPLVFMLILNHQVNNWLILNEKQGTVYTKNTYQNQIGRLRDRINLYALISLIENVLGEIWYVLIASFGLIGVGILAVLKKMIKAFKEKDILWCFYMFLILSFLGMLGVSSLNSVLGAPLGVDGRYDIVFYGRYLEAVVGIFILFGLMEVVFLRNRRKEFAEVFQYLISIVLISIFLSFFIHFVTEAYQNNGFNYFSITAVLTTFFNPLLHFSVIRSSFVGIILMITLFYMYTRKNKAYSYVGCIIILCFFSFTGYNIIYNLSTGFEKFFVNSELEDICNFVIESNIEKIGINSNDEYDGVNFQIALPNVKILFTDLEKENFDKQEYLYAISDKESLADIKINNILYENNKYVLYQK